MEIYLDDGNLTLLGVNENRKLEFSVLLAEAKWGYLWGYF